MWIARGFRPRRLFRIDPLFTMSDSTRADAGRPEPKASGARNLFLADEHRSCWWSQTGSNRRPPACKAGALPTELWPRSEDRDQMTEVRRSVGSDICHLTSVIWWAWEDLNFRPHAYQARALTS